MRPFHWDSTRWSAAGTIHNRHVTIRAEEVKAGCMRKHICTDRSHTGGAAHHGKGLLHVIHVRGVPQVVGPSLGYIV